MRGRSHLDGVLCQHMLERTHSPLTACELLLRRDEWMSDVIQIKITEHLAHAVQSKIVSSEFKYYRLAADGGTFWSL